MKLTRKDIEAILWLLRELITLFLKLKKENHDNKQESTEGLA